MICRVSKSEALVLMTTFVYICCIRAGGSVAFSLLLLLID